MLSSRINLRSGLVQPWHSVRHSQSRYPEPCLASLLRFQRYQSTVQKPISRPKPTNISSASPEQRRRDLEQHGWTSYPRPGLRSARLSSLVNEFEKDIAPGEARVSAGVAVTARVSSVRSAGSKLLFITVYQSPQSTSPRRNDLCTSLQVVVDQSQIANQNDSSTNSVKNFGKLIQRGDTIHVSGHLYRTPKGELSIRATQIPRLLSPCLHQIPTEPLTNESEHAQDRHVHMLADTTWLKTVYGRSALISSIEEFLRKRDFLKVHTPILAASAGGATARPFETTATEFAGRKLALRIAPELWLKKLLIGGISRVFEVGQSFRNEGIDKTHNPEFTTAEFYAVGWGIEQLKESTQTMFDFVLTRLIDLEVEIGVGVADLITSKSSWPSIDFIPALNEALGQKLPDLSSSTAREDVLEIFSARGLPIPSVPTLPRLLDKLSSIYLEPQCDKPTWIVNTPECLSPLAKSFAHPDFPHHKVAARAELFIKSKELVNCYEEENSPDEQRRKFVDQQKHASLDGEVDLEAMKIDEDYLRALEWGLPPTGGWGCGIERLCMVFLGKDKISDVLPFGNLRMVTHGAEKSEQAAEKQRQSIERKRHVLTAKEPENSVSESLS